MWDHVYHMQHRGGEIGHHHAKQIGDNHYEMTFTDMYPDLLKYGIAYGFARRLLPQGTHVKIWYGEETPQMDNGDESTIMYIKW